MMNVLLIIFYVFFAVAGSTLLKLGGVLSIKKFLIPFVNINVSWVSVMGFVFYGLSFLTYTVLLNKYDLSFISPLTVALVYVFLMITAFVIFKEPINLQKVIGSLLILVGILLMVINKKL